MKELGIEKTDRGNWMSTYTGRKYYPFDPRPEEVEIQDIARGLSNEARFAGQCRFFSVAEHSVNASYCVPPEHRLTALLHDAPEAYLGDIPRPIKMVEEFKAVFEPLEHKNWVAIARRFDLQGLDDDYELPKCVHAADSLVLCNEARHLKHVHWDDWGLITHESKLLEDVREGYGIDTISSPHRLRAIPKHDMEVIESIITEPPECLSPDDAMELFLNRFAELVREEIVARERSGDITKRPTIGKV